MFTINCPHNTPQKLAIRYKIANKDSISEKLESTKTVKKRTVINDL